ncbi:MAG: hypothetical protein RRB22_08485 [Gammaproteobacteria bacterium]|nr:hypothetical protein [Gammaproteobacteria bacterium]
MNTDTRPFANHLQQFAEHQLSGVSMRDIHASTVQLLLSTVFFTGAAIAIARRADTPKKIYLPVLRRLLIDRFGLSDERAAGMIESNARLYKRYVLIEKVYHAGWTAASDPRPADAQAATELKALLKKYQDLGMSGLNIEGTKQQSIDTAVDEAVRPAEAEAVFVPPSSHWRQNALLVLLVVLLTGAGYLLFFTEYFAGLGATLGAIAETLRETLGTTLGETLDKIIKTVSAFVTETLLSLNR